MKYISLSNYLKNEYGEKYYKLALSCATSCPNRDGICGYGGCIFCSSKGSGDFAQDVLLPISEQIEKAKDLIKSKSDNDKYVAYFQAFTSTYGDFEYLKKTFTETINRDDVAILSIATRPDCLNDDILGLLSKLNKIKPVWVELGLQSIHQSTAEYIRRGYETSVYFDAVRKLKAIGVHVITHIIIGLPFETNEMIVETAREVGKVTDGVKLQLLHVLKGTDLADEYEKGVFETLSIEEYADILCECINAMPENVVIHRLTGDGDKNTLISPTWTKDKKRVLNFINHKIAKYERNSS
ncbi:MAG: TIGR01212 family radical SAM protein [Ruminococcus sp.]|nr:TIGR01212 family radical SAM protein [Ruminococcus sp.]